MLGRQLLRLRKIHGFTQEDVAERVGVSRQTIAKWESGESVPDLVNGHRLALLYNVSLDDVAGAADGKVDTELGPKGKYVFGTVTVDDARRITLPEKACRMFHIQAGSELVLLGDITQGLALMEAGSFFAGLDDLRRRAGEKEQIDG